MEFLNMWYITILINDLLIILGSILKLSLAHYVTIKFAVSLINYFSELLNALFLYFHDPMLQKISNSELYVTCTITLGIGNLLMWSGVLRYFGFFSKYNVRFSPFNLNNMD